MRLLACRRALKSVCRLLTASLLVAALGPFAAETATAQTESSASLPEWGVTGSMPQTGLSAYTSGKAFSVSNGQPGTTAPTIPAEARPATAAPAPSPKAEQPQLSKILILIDKSTQEMKVLVGDVERYIWQVSTGLRSYDTPTGTYTARSMNEIWYSKQWDDAPMPHAIFFTKKGHAIHGTEETKKLGRPASHGCVRLAPENASTLFALVKENGLANTEVVLTGEIAKAEVRAASQGSRKPQIKSAKNTGATLRRGVTSGRSRVAISGPGKPQITVPKPKEAALSGGEKVTSSASPKPEIKPSKQLAYPKFDPYNLDRPRRLSRKEWYRLYYSGPPQISPPRGAGEPPPRQRRLFRSY